MKLHSIYDYDDHWYSKKYINTQRKESYILYHDCKNTFSPLYGTDDNRCYLGLMKTQAYYHECMCTPPDYILEKHREICRLITLKQKLKA